MLSLLLLSCQSSFKKWYCKWTFCLKCFIKTFFLNLLLIVGLDLQLFLRFSSSVWFVISEEISLFLSFSLSFNNTIYIISPYHSIFCTIASLFAFISLSLLVSILIDILVTSSLFLMFIIIHSSFFHYPIFFQFSSLFLHLLYPPDN